MRSSEASGDRITQRNGTKWQLSALSGPKRRALAALLTEPTVKAAAASCGTPERTFHRWLADDHSFRMAYRFAAQRALDQAISGLQLATQEAVSTLRASLDSESDSVRVRAALGVLDMAARLDDHARERASTSLTTDEASDLLDRAARLVKRHLNPEQQRLLADDLRALKG